MQPHTAFTALMTVAHSVDSVPLPYLDDTLIFLFVSVSNGAGKLRPKLNKLFKIALTFKKQPPFFFNFA